jgi:putative oxidoreductase
MRRLTASPAVDWVLKLAVAAVFMHAGAMKLRTPEGFAAQIAGFHLAPMPLAPWLATMLPWLELLAGFLLVANRRGRAAAFALLVLSAGFSVAVGQAIMRGLEPACGCFGEAETLSSASLWLALGRDLALLAVTAWLYRRASVEAWRDDLSRA